VSWKNHPNHDISSVASDLRLLAPGVGRPATGDWRLATGDYFL